MSHTWQFDVAEHAIQLATDDAADPLTHMSVIDERCWGLIRAGRLAETRDFAIQWADDAEPRMSKAGRDELAAWGRFLLRVSTAAVRDNRPGEARDALRLAKMAAAGTGSDFLLPYNPWQVFGPATVAIIQAENAMIQDRPDVTLGIAAQIEGKPFPVSRHYHRHRLDVAHAHTAMRQYPMPSRYSRTFAQPRRNGWCSSATPQTSCRRSSSADAASQPRCANWPTSCTCRSDWHFGDHPLRVPWCRPDAACDIGRHDSTE